MNPHNNLCASFFIKFSYSQTISVFLSTIREVLTRNIHNVKLVRKHFIKIMELKLKFHRLFGRSDLKWISLSKSVNLKSNSLVLNQPLIRFYSTSNTSPKSNGEKHGTEASQKSEKAALSMKEKLKIAVRDYGSTVIVFHITHSLTLLGIIYIAISSGLDVKWLLLKIGMGDSNIATGASTFVVAYAVNKVLAPVRMSITLTGTPFIVRYLRKLGFLKPPSSS